MFFQCCVYFLSFTPLWISILFIEIMSLIHGAEDNVVEIGYIILITALMAIALFYSKSVFCSPQVGGVKCELKSAKEEKLAIAEFLATYILPLFAFDFTLWEGMTLFLFFFIVFGWICVHHNYFCANIILDVWGYRIYETVVLDHEQEVEVKVISKSNLKTHIGENLVLKWINNDYSFEVAVNPINEI